MLLDSSNRLVEDCIIKPLYIINSHNLWAISVDVFIRMMILTVELMGCRKQESLNNFQLHSLINTALNFHYFVVIYLFAFKPPLPARPAASHLLPSQLGLRPCPSSLSSLVLLSHTIQWLCTMMMAWCGEKFEVQIK